MPIIREEYRADESGNNSHISLSGMNLAIAQVQTFCLPQAFELNRGGFVQGDDEDLRQEFFRARQHLLRPQEIGARCGLEDKIEAPAQQFDPGDDGSSHIRIAQRTQALDHARMPGVQVGEGVGIQQVHYLSAPSS